MKQTVLQAKTVGQQKRMYSNQANLALPEYSFNN